MAKSPFEASSGPQHNSLSSDVPALPERSKPPSMTIKLLRLMAWLLITTIVVLSLVPPFVRPTTPAPHDVEHLSIFLLAGVVFALGYRFKHLRQAVGFVVFAGAIEVAQLAVPGRHARIGDFIVDATSACIGVLAAALLGKVLGHRGLIN